MDRCFRWNDAVIKELKTKKRRGIQYQGKRMIAGSLDEVIERWLKNQSMETSI